MDLVHAIVLPNRFSLYTAHFHKDQSPEKLTEAWEQSETDIHRQWDWRGKHGKLFQSWLNRPPQMSELSASRDKYGDHQRYCSLLPVLRSIYRSKTSESKNWLDWKLCRDSVGRWREGCVPRPVHEKGILLIECGSGHPVLASNRYSEFPISVFDYSQKRYSVWKDFLAFQYWNEKK